MERPENIIKSISSKNDFLHFLDALNEDLRNNASSWENITLPDYLEALQRWTEDMEGYYINTGVPVPDNVNWKVFADILYAAKIYE